VSTRRVVIVVFVAVGICLVLAAGVSGGSWRDLWLNLLAETVGAAFIVLVVDVLFERSRARDREAKRRVAIVELGSIFRELQTWRVRMLAASGSATEPHEHADDLDALAANLHMFVEALGAIDFAAPGALGRDRYFVEWARRSFDATTDELAHWELHFVDSGGLFDDEFRRGAESLRRFVRTMSSFLEGMELYVLREQPTTPVHAYDGVTELTADRAAVLASELEEFLRFYGAQRERYGISSS